MLKGASFFKTGSLPRPAANPSHIREGPNTVEGIAVPEEQVESLPPVHGHEGEDHRDANQLETEHAGEDDEDPYNVIPSMGDGMMEVPLDGPPESAALLDPDRKSVNRSSKEGIYSETQGWDVFQVLEPEEDNHGNEKLIKIVVQVIKLFVYILIFLLVLTCAVVAKGCLLFIAGNMIPGKNVQLCGDVDVKGGFTITRSTVITENVTVTWVWAMYLAYCVPELFSFLYSLRKTTFRSLKPPPISMILLVIFLEIVHTVGLGILLFVVLPYLDAVRGAMITNCLCFVPAILQWLSRNSSEKLRWVKMGVDTFAIICQISGFVIWPLLHPTDNLWSIPVALIMTSVVWWENFLDKKSPFAVISKLAAKSEYLYKTRYRIYVFLSPIKCLVMLGTMIGFMSMSIHVDALMDSRNIFRARNLSVLVTRTPMRTTDEISDANSGLNIFDFKHTPVSDNELWEIAGTTSLVVWLIQIAAAVLCYLTGKFACRIVIQQFSFAFPISISMPVLVSGLVAVCGLRLQDNCFGTNILPKHLFFNMFPGNGIEDLILNEHVWIWLLWLFSQVWVTFHIWNPKCERLAKAEKLFVLPMYHGLIIDQDLALNRRRDDQAEVLSEDLKNGSQTAEDPSPHYETLSIKSVDSSKEKPSHRTADTVTKIIACATMWHETRDEMKQILKSITRMDEDQAARRNAQEFLQVVDPDYYEYQTHIFFDDAFEISDENENENVVNHFVRLLCGVIDEAASAVHQTNIKLRPPVLISTPYGGRLVWTFPGGTKMYVHLKDKSKIRHRKRWSQVMYMYYLLGYNLMDLPIDVTRKETIAENTYLLTLDGDIDFKPHAVQLLVDLMKKNKGLGATCGRIHPVGSGMMVWYQRFEYAIGHWLQKATEHMIGCVMCCPGCFSLFRAKTLMDDNVMRRYAVKAEEALHYVQFDQGEDRWLCTLILQRGYRVEYCAASDAWTHAPEGFNEFFNQRRRWVPSTIANILDLLLDAKNVVNSNDNISWGYILYQLALMIGTILGPATIFMMIIGACVAAFRVDNWTAFWFNIVPIMLYIVVCLTMKANWQLLLAQIMSTLYALLMMAVIVGTAIQINDDGWGSPSAIFLIALVGSFFSAAILHPQEFFCIGHGFLYFLSIPAMYLLLMIYSLCNLNVVSWGTRETATKKTQAEVAREKAEAEKAAKAKQQEGFMGFMRKIRGDTANDNGMLLNCCTVNSRDDSEKEELIKIGKTLDMLTQKVDLLSKSQYPEGLPPPPEWPLLPPDHPQFYNNLHQPVHAPVNLHMPVPFPPTLVAMNEDFENGSLGTHVYGEVEEEEEIIKYWMKDKCFGEVNEDRVVVLEEKEVQFWKDLIKKYLYPLDEDKAAQQRIANDLKELRNKSVFMYFMFNALFILIVFLLQLNKYHLHVDWPLGVKTNVTIINNQPVVTKEYLQLEPIGIVFVVFFFSILVIQFVAMVFHRFGTLSHILAATDIDWFKRRAKKDQQELIKENAIEIARNLQALRGINDPTDNYRDDDDPRGPGFRKTIQHLEKQRRRKQKVGTLDVAFKKRFQELKSQAVRKRYPMRTIDPETEKAMHQLVEEQKRVDNPDVVRSPTLVGFAVDPNGKDVEKGDMFDTAENRQGPRMGMRSRRRLEDIFHNLTGHEDPHDGFANDGFDPYDLGDDTVGGDFDRDRRSSSHIVQENSDSPWFGKVRHTPRGTPKMPRRSPSLHTLDRA
ncbi:chitin synthase chs-2-like [Paramacrobiotus metropolitanus]|uniref:chitin synthase chs-2-like n=1 Tax=Paramacrobiotus metropolitanus TaxID=2943436 RepID=UPI002445DC0C|nr:chitin synthase chs-2-like [Paramacrobiotus metropolitanus]